MVVMGYEEEVVIETVAERVVEAKADNEGMAVVKRVRGAASD